MKPIVVTPTHVFVRFHPFSMESSHEHWSEAATAFAKGCRSLAEYGSPGGGREVQADSCMAGWSRWAMLPIDTARIVVCAFGYGHRAPDPFTPGSLRFWDYRLFGLPVTRMRDARTAHDAITRYMQRHRLGRDRRPQYERTRRLELLRLLGIKRHGWKGTATRIHSAPPRWDGFGHAPYAWVDVPDDINRPISARVNDRGQLLSILGGGEVHRLAFGSPGSHLTLERVDDQ